MRSLNKKEAERYLVLRKEAAPKIAMATFLCIISPVCLIVLCGISDAYPSIIPENIASGIGMCVLIAMVAGAVTCFMKCAAADEEFRFLEEEPFETDAEAREMINAKKEAYRTMYSRLNIRGTILCIISVLPVMMALCLEGCVFGEKRDLIYVCAVGFLLVIVASGCYSFIYGGVYQAAINKLLMEKKGR